MRIYVYTNTNKKRFALELSADISWVPYKALDSLTRSPILNVVALIGPEDSLLLRDSFPILSSCWYDFVQFGLLAREPSCSRRRTRASDQAVTRPMAEQERPLN